MLKLIKEFFSALWEVFKLPFFLIAEGFRRLFRLGWRKITMLTTAAVILTVVVLFSFFEVTSQPNFCGSCHLMQPYVDAWATSSHSDVPCMTCHAKAGLKGYLETKFTALSMLANYVTGLYKRSKPWAEIEDANCLQCHETRLLEGKIRMANGVKFDHTPHLTERRRGRQLRCTSCHSQIVQGEHISITPTTCFLCHFKNLDKEDRQHLSDCMLCHDVPKKGEAKFDHTQVGEDNIPCQSCHQPMWQGEGLVRKERCGSCHSQTDHINRFNDLEFIHDWHIEKRKVDCQRCHDPIEHKQPDLDQTVSGNCNSCHSDPHEPKLAIYEGKGSRLVEGEFPNVMYTDGVACVSCHKNPVTHGGEARAGENACEPCHSQSYRKLADNWRASYDAQIARLETQLKKAGGHPQLEDARHDLALLKSGGAWHNPGYADKILAGVRKVVREAGGTTRPPATLPKASEKCLVCHSGIDAVDVKLPDSPFNHSAHLSDRKISCETCHVGGQPEDPAHGQRKPTGQSCNTCHHGENATAQDACSPCHVPSRSLFTGEVPGLPVQPSPMADAGMTCTDCHDASNGFQPPKEDFCLGCHEQETVDQWKYNEGELVRALKANPPKADPARLVGFDHGRAVHNPDLAKKILGVKE